MEGLHDGASDVPPLEEPLEDAEPLEELLASPPLPLPASAPDELPVDASAAPAEKASPPQPGLRERGTRTTSADAGVKRRIIEIPQSSHAAGRGQGGVAQFCCVR